MVACRRPFNLEKSIKWLSFDYLPTGQAGAQDDTIFALNIPKPISSLSGYETLYIHASLALGIGRAVRNESVRSTEPRKSPTEVRGNAQKVKKLDHDLTFKTIHLLDFSYLYKKCKLFYRLSFTLGRKVRAT